MDDPDGTPAQNVQIDVVRLADGTPLLPVIDPQGAGSYTVIDDQQRQFVSMDGTELGVSGTRGDLGFEEVLLVGTDSCGCHVERIEGPERVTLSGSP